MQYDCHSDYFISSFWLIFGLTSIVFFLPLLFVLLLRSLKNVVKFPLSDIALFSRVPKAIRDEFNAEFVRKPVGYLRLRDFAYVKNILFNSGLRPYFIFRSIWKLAVYSELIDIYQPKRIWVTQEMVFESSLLTSYLADFDVEHNNFMHGDNYFSIQVAFSTFTNFYVWDPYYVDLFTSLHCESKNFIVFYALERSTSLLPQRKLVKYYCQDSKNVQVFKTILKNLKNFSVSKQCELVVRLHPLHKKQFEIETLKEKGIPLEENTVDPIDSILESEYVCSEFSAVLYQASLLNRKIVIDNTFPERLELIKDLDPIFLTKLPHEFLVTS